MKGFPMQRDKVRKSLRYLGLKFDKSKLPDGKGVQYHIKSDIFKGIVVTCYNTGTVIVQGKDEAAKNIIGIFLKLRSDKLQMEAYSS